MISKDKKFYCYVDETGQDVGSKFFIVVTIISEEEQNKIRNKLLNLESISKVHARKWFNSRSPIKEKFLQLVMKEQVAKGDVYYGKFEKPTPFFEPMLETIEKAIKYKIHNKNYKTIIYVDGIDQKKANELTKILRKRGVSLKLVRTVRDESESMIRLADRWAGCIRDAFEGKIISKKILSDAEKTGYIKSI